MNNNTNPPNTLPELSPNELAFANSILNGNKKNTAYLTHIDPNATQKSAKTNGAKISKRPHIQQYLKLQKAQLSNNCLKSRIQIFKEIEKIAKARTTPASTKLTAWLALAKLHGYDIPQNSVKAVQVQYINANKVLATNPPSPTKADIVEVK